jgi:hypothetical protein
MATLLELAGPTGPLFKLDVLDAHQQEFRCIYMSEKLKNWVANDLQTLAATWETEISCRDQVFELTEMFCAGDELDSTTQFHALRPYADGVWELKTGDVRIFGWFPIKDQFVGVVAHDAYFVKRHDLYHGLIGEVVRFRDALDLDAPKFVPGDNPHAVVSNCY